MQPWPSGAQALLVLPKRYLACRLLEPHQPVMPVVSYMMDAANGSIEYDVVKQDDQAISTLSLSGPMDALCPQASSFGLLRCLGHQHIGGKCMRLINQDTGEELCRSCPSYGSANRHVAGNEQGYLVKMSEAALGHPKQIMPGANVTIESDYDASVDHFGVMALFFLDLVDFDKSCPGPVTAFTGALYFVCKVCCIACFRYQNTRLRLASVHKLDTQTD